MKKLCKDINLLIAEKLNDQDLINFFSINKYARELSFTEIFWKNRLTINYPEIVSYKSPTRTYKDFYLSYVKILNSTDEIKGWIIETNKEINQLLYNASKYKDVDIIHYFLDKGANKMYGMYGAAESGNENIVEFFAKKEVACWNNGMSRAALHGHKHLVDYFIAKGAKIWKWGLESAQEGKHEDLIQFFQDKLS